MLQARTGVDTDSSIPARVKVKIILLIQISTEMNTSSPQLFFLTKALLTVQCIPINNHYLVYTVTDQNTQGSLGTSLRASV